MDKQEKNVVGVYDSDRDAVAAIAGLIRQGYDVSEISVIGKHGDEVAKETGTSVEDSAATGAVTGGALGGITGLLAGAGALAIPGIGPIIAAGPIVSGLMGALTGAGLGGLTGALVGMGIPDDEAEYYENSLKDGKIIVLTEKKHVDNRNDRNYLHDDMEDRNDQIYLHEDMEHRNATLVAGHPHQGREHKGEFISEKAPSTGSSYKSREMGSSIDEKLPLNHDGSTPLEEADNSSMAQDYGEIKKLGNEMEENKTEQELRKDNLKPDPLQSDKQIGEYANASKSW